ncbi:MAG: hypothetical protein EA387_15805 [Nitriliruptor sp.]|nr:MAG: hypothetical protein EA387_15805 [Nitriliruptor sp.]
MRRLTLGTAALAAAALLAGCTGVPDGAAEAQALVCPPGEPGCDEILPIGPGGAVEVEMGNFFFNVTDGIAITGEIEVTAVNISDAYHNIEFLGAADGTYLGGSDGEAVVGADGFETDVGQVALFPGEWLMICNVPGHRAAGMELPITVYATEEEAELAIEAGETDVDRDREMPNT